MENYSSSFIPIVVANAISEFTCNSHEGITIFAHFRRYGQTFREESSDWEEPEIKQDFC